MKKEVQFMYYLSKATTTFDAIVHYIGVQTV